MPGARIIPCYCMCLLVAGIFLIGRGQASGVPGDGQKLPVPRVSSPRLVKRSRVALVTADSHTHIYTLTHTFTIHAHNYRLAHSWSPRPSNHQLKTRTSFSPRRRLYFSFREDCPGRSTAKTKTQQHNQTTTMSAVRQIALVTHTVVRPAAKTHVRRLSSSASSGGPPTVRPLSRKGKVSLLILRCASYAPAFPPYLCAHDPFH